MNVWILGEMKKGPTKLDEALTQKVVTAICKGEISELAARGMLGLFWAGSSYRVCMLGYYNKTHGKFSVIRAGDKHFYMTSATLGAKCLQNTPFLVGMQEKGII